MPVNELMPRRNLSTTEETNRGPSNAIWSRFPRAEVQGNPDRGVYHFFDFDSMPKTPPTTEDSFGLYSAFTSSGGTLAAGTGTGGEWVLGEATDNEGVGIRQHATPFRISTSHKLLCFEARVKRSTIADTTGGFLLGLIEDTAITATVPITAAGAIADKNFVGFRADEADGDQIDFAYKADGVTAVNIDTDILPTALAADTYVKLGFVFEHNPDLYTGTKYVLTAFVNGVRKTTTKTIPTAAGTDFPNDISLGMIFSMLLAAGSAFTTTIDWWACGQLFY